jgi:hypothetical protein
MLRAFREAAINAAYKVARDRAGAASVCDIARLGRKVVHEVKVMRVLLKLISSTAGNYSCVENMGFSHAPGIES